ncbi:MAG: radical SAM protein [Candidatus Buchananbacteria bacterium]
MADIEIKLVFYRTLFSQSAASVTMGSLAAFLEQHNFCVSLCLWERDGLHNAEKITTGRNKINIVIAKPNFKDFKLMIPLLAELKKQKATAKVFFCGPFASINANSIMADLPWLDGIIIGQPEETALELLSLISQKKPIKKCAGGIWRKATGGRVSSYQLRSHRLKLNELPFPRRDVEKTERGLYVNLEASRGCVGQCSFCHIPLISNLTGCSAIDYRQPKLVVKEMARLYKTLGKELFIFNDSCFWRNDGDNERILEFCRELKKLKLPLKFYIYLKCYPRLPDKILAALSEAGLVRVFLGIENISNKSQKVFNKKIPLTAYEEIKKQFDRYGINIHIGYIVAEPYSSLDDINNNLKYLRKIGKLFRLGVILETVRVVPQSGLHRQLLKDGLIASELSYDKLTYGYKYKYPAVGRFVAEIKKLFLMELNPEAYEFEYYCTTGDILRVLCRRWDHRVYHQLDDVFSQFYKQRDKIMDLLLDFLLQLSRTAALDKNKKLFMQKRRQKFITDFRREFLVLQVHYAVLCREIKNQGGERVVNCLYHGLERV